MTAIWGGAWKAAVCAWDSAGCHGGAQVMEGRVDLVDLLCEVGLVLLGVLLVFRLLPSGCMRGREEAVSAAGEHGEEDW